MRVERLYRFPVKGLSAESLEATELSAGETLPHDRRFALAQGDAPFDPATPRFLPKQNFACMMANARVVLLHSAFDPRSGILSLRTPGGELLHGDTRSEVGRAVVAAFLARFLGSEIRGTPRFLDVPGHSFSDQKRKCVSFVNLATLRALETAIGRPLDHLRFRANVYFSGLAAWEEFGWVDREVLLGGARLAVFGRTRRCPATQVDLRTAERDCDVPRLLREHFGHSDFGVHAEVREGGRVSVGDALEAF